MGLHKDLPIYKVVYDLLGFVVTLAGNMPRNLRRLLRQATHSRADRARLANLLRRRGFAVDRQLTRCFR